MSVEVRVTDHSDLVIKALNVNVIKALEECGMVAEGYAKIKVPVDSGLLKNSINYIVKESEKACYIGTNVIYGKYVEMGTGIYAEGGRRTGWAYMGEDLEWHYTHGSKPRPFIKPAVADHKKEYVQIIKNNMKG